MLGTNNVKANATIGGIAIAVLLTVLMAMSPMTGLVDNQTETAEFVEINETEDEDFFALPDTIEKTEYELDASRELIGARDSTSKTFVNEDGDFVAVHSSEPLHYMSDEGSWEDIDLNIKATSFGWAVSENVFETRFASEVANGVAVQPNQWVDPVVTGINPMLVTIDESGTAVQPFAVPASNAEVAVGGNTIRYPLAEGFDIDYTVETFQVKQDLVIRERPTLEPNAAWFGLTESLRLPAGYALYHGEVLLTEEITQTQDALQIRNIETGELYAEIPAPVVMEEGKEPYHATFFVSAMGTQVFLTTAVEADWLMSEDRVFPLALDPSIKVTSGAGGYCYVYYNYCYSSTSRYLYRSGSSVYYLPWSKYTFSSSSALPSGATISEVAFKQYYTYHSGSTNAGRQVTILESCGQDVRYNWGVTSRSCSGSLSSSYLTSNYGGTAARSLTSSIWNSVQGGSFGGGTGWKTTTLCSSSGTACSSTTGAHNYILNAQSNNGVVGVGAKLTSSSYVYSYATGSGSNNMYIQITYTGGTDADAPTADFVPYTGITSYMEGERTFFMSLFDMSGIDTTSGNEPTLYYRVNNASTWTSQAATTLGTCGTSDTDCKFKATTTSISAGDYVEYYWKFRDLNQGSNGANVGYEPALTSGQTTPTPYYFAVEDVVDAGNAKKMTILTTDVHAGSAFNPSGYMDRQITYFDNSHEYVFEFDTSNCGTGSAACWYTSSYYFYNNWKVKWLTGTSTSGTTGSGTVSGDNDLLLADDGYLSLTADDGPGQNLIFVYDSTSNDFAMVGLGTQTGIEEPLSGGSSATQASTYGYTKAFRFQVPGDITGEFANIEFNASNSGAANWVCTGSNGWTLFIRSSSSSPSCSSGYYYIYSTYYKWNGFAIASGYYGRMASTGDVTYNVAKVAPEPDTYAPTITHTALADSYSPDRTVTATIVDDGVPPTGLNVSTTAGVGPTLYYRVNSGSWTSLVMDPAGSATRADCATAGCDWQADIENLETNDQVEYYMTAEDVSTTQINDITSSTNTFEVGDPNKVFIVEWHDMGYTSTYLCTYQAVFYDVTNEFEFKYDTGCQMYYDYSAVGYMDTTRTKGETFHKGSGYAAGAMTIPSNYRVHTSSTSYGHETFDLGMTSITNYDTAISGSSNGRPYGYYCASSYYWNTYKSSCNANIDLPDDFVFEYFGTEYNGTDSNDRVQIGRQGYMYFIDSGSTALQRGVTTWSSNMPNLPYSGNSAARPGTIAPWWGYYSSYYCYDNTNIDCSVRYRTMPFNGKGTDVDSDITNPTSWDLVDSPIRINPSNDYLSVSADLTIEAGVVVQVAAGKGISFDGTCDSMTINGNESAHVMFEGQNGADWKGIAFTAACAAAGGTDDRHTFSYVDFYNTSDAAIAAGSRHGSNPSATDNVGNFTMTEVTFTNVANAIQHGSGDNTGFDLTSVSVSGADDSCLDMPDGATLTAFDLELENCNTNGGSADGAIKFGDGGNLMIENSTIDNAYGNVINFVTAADDIHISNLSVTNSFTSTQTGGAIMTGGANAGSDMYVYNMNVGSGYTDGISSEATDSFMLEMVDLGSGDITYLPGGSTSSANGPTGDMAILDDVTSGDITLARTAPGTFDQITAGDVKLSGNSPATDQVRLTSLNVGSIMVDGCGWSVGVATFSADDVSSSCSSSAAPNTLVVRDGSLAHADSTTNAVYARNSHVTLGVVDITSSDISSTNGNYVAKASTNADIVLIDVDYNNVDCSDRTTASCTVDVSSSAEVWYGGIAQVGLYRMALVNGASTQVFKAGHNVVATVVDSNTGNELFSVGTHITDNAGIAEVWVISEDESGNTYSDHHLRAFGAAGQNTTTAASSWYPSGGFGVGDSIDLLLEPAPMAFDQPNMDCAWLASNQTTSGMYNPGLNAYVWDSTPMTMSADLTLDGCHIALMGSVLTVQASATNTPVLTISNGGALTLNVSSDTGAAGTLQASTSTYPLTVAVTSGDLTVDGGTVRDLAQDSATNSALYIPSGSSLSMSNSGTIYGASASADDMATVKVDGGSLEIIDSSIVNTGQTGTALHIESAGATIQNIAVSNAAVGIQSYNAAPQVDGFTSTNNDVGVNVYGGMSLPTIYRSTQLSGQSTGWTTYAIDLSTFLGSGDYLQVGANSIYGGGNAHPTYNYFTSKYYFITDRYNIEYEDDNGNSWNITSSSDLGYYPYGDTNAAGVHSSDDPASGVGDVATYAGGTGGAPSWHCNYYGYSYGPNYQYGFEGYFYYFYYYWLGSGVSYPAYYYTPDEFGFGWEDIPGVTPTGSYSYYPYKYWSQYSPSSQYSGIYAPPEGYAGLFGYYNVCVDYAYSYYMSSGEGARLTYPIVDISASNISKVTLYMDVLHKGADNYQDRYEFVARAGNDPSDLGDYARESGTPMFKDGTINGADTGIELGGNFAAASFEDITVNSPNDAGMDIVGGVMASVDDMTVNGGNYGVLVSSGASGQVDITNVDLDGQALAGVYYTKDLGGDFTGTVQNSAGPAFKYGTNTKDPVTMSSMTISSNNVGIEAGGSGEFTLTDVTMANTNDVQITGSSTMDFIEGTVDTATVTATGTGVFNRMRLVDVTVTADGSAIDGTNVVLRSTEGDITGMATTDSNGLAADLTFTTQVVDNSGLTTKDLTGYEAITTAEVEYYRNSNSDNKADFRYAFESLSLSDTSGNSESVALTDRFTSRVCYSFSSSSYQMVARCLSGISTGGSRDFSDGAGGTLKEYGYYRATSGTDLQGETVMLDAPFIYLGDGSHDWNQSTFIGTAAYSFYGNMRISALSNADVDLYMHDSEMVATATNEDDNTLFGIQLGYEFYSMDYDIDNSILNGIATIIGSVGYGYYSDYELEHFSITNSEITHYKGYTQLTGAIQDTDMCIQLQGGDGALIDNNTFNNCATGVILERSRYYYSHSPSEYGADNVTISNNTFNDGRQVIWFDQNSYSDDAVVENNVINGGNIGILLWDDKTERATLDNNEVTANYGLYLRAEGWTASNNIITGTGEGSSGIYTYGGNGEVIGNTVIDAHDGIVIEGPVAVSSGSVTNLCSIAGNSYSYQDSCTFTFNGGTTLYIDVDTDNYGSETSLEITKPDGSKDTWSRYSFSSNTQYSPFTSYTASGTYTITVFDSYGDGGPDIDAYYSSSGALTGMVVSDNTVGLSSGEYAPNAQGFSFEACSGTFIDSDNNSVTLSDNAMIIDGCDIQDAHSVLTGTDLSASTGLWSDAGDNVNLDGTDISGFATGLYMDGGALNMIGDASVAGSDYGVEVENAAVTAIGASVDGGTTGTGLSMVDGAYSWIYPLDAAGLVGVYAENTEFRWDGGVSTATTALHAVEAMGKVENLTWTDSTTQINAGTNAYVTSIGNTVDPSALVVDSTARIDEANLLDADVNHLGEEPTQGVGVLIQTTDMSHAAYVSPNFQPDIMSIDGDDSDWTGTLELSPADDVAPGMMSGDGTNDFMTTYIEGDDLYIALTGEDFANSDALIYMDVTSGGSSTGYDYGGSGAHSLPFDADFLLWADDDSSYDLYAYGFLGWGVTSLSGDSVDADMSTSFAEFQIPFSRMGGMPSEVRIIAIVQGESSATVSTVHPTQTIDSASSTQTFSDYLTVELGADNLDDGVLTDEVLIYRSFLGSNSPSDGKVYDVTVKHSATCGGADWAVYEDVDMSGNQDISIDILRACPTISDDLDDVDSTEDAASTVIDLNPLASDEQDLAADLVWSVVEGATTTVYSSSLLPADGLVEWDLTGQTFTITPVADQFGTVEFTLTVTDSNGLSVDRNIDFTIAGVNDAPEICYRPQGGEVCESTIVLYGNAANPNLIPEDQLQDGASPNDVVLSTVANQGNSAVNLIKDMSNENDPQVQTYTWDVTVEENCPLFTATVDSNTNLHFVGLSGRDFHAGGSCDITMSLTDDGAENTDANDEVITVYVVPENDAPEIVNQWDSNAGETITWASNGTTVENYAGEWGIRVLEDTTDSDALTFDLSGLKSDVDNDDSDLYWVMSPTIDPVTNRPYCTSNNYFSYTISGDTLTLDLVPNAATNAPAYEIDYNQNGGVNQEKPSGKNFCEMDLFLYDSTEAPAGHAYDLYGAEYVQGSDVHTVEITVENVDEQIPDFAIVDESGFNFNGVTNVMTGTWVPTTVSIEAGGDEGPYNNEQMLKISFFADGSTEAPRDPIYVAAPAFGETIDIDSEVFITSTSSIVWVEVDALTCVGESCDMTLPVDQRFFMDNDAHGATTLPNSINYWVEPGAYGDSSERRPFLEDKDWCNNVMYSTQVASINVCDAAERGRGEFPVTEQNLPDVVSVIGAAGVPSFAPSIVAVALAGFLISALALAGRRDEEDEEVVEETIVDDETAVSPVIATILMVAITVVLSGVIYVWASSLADTDVKGVPRITFEIETVDGFEADDGHWKISVQQTEVELATQAVIVKLFYQDATGSLQVDEYNLANPEGVYGFNPANSDSQVSFVDSVNRVGDQAQSTFNVGDVIYVRTHLSDGTPLDDVTITISYSPEVGDGAQLRTYDGLSYDKLA